MQFAESTGMLFVLSAPSGAGKTTVAGKLLETMAGLKKTVSFTTRPPRPGEKDGADYFFVDKAAFQRMIAKGQFIEWAEVYGNYYGTSAGQIEEALKEGTDLLLVIDVQGARSVRSMDHLNSRDIFLLPPSMEELKRRLSGRGEDPEESILLRLKEAQEEMSHKDEFRHRVVNDNLEKAVEEVRSIVMMERTKRMLSGGETRGNAG